MAASSLEVRPLDDASWAEGMRLCGRAFSGYQYVRALVGDDPVARLAATTREFGSSAWDPTNLGVVVWAGDALVGIAAITVAAGCRLCRADRGGPTGEPPSPEDPIAVAGVRFDEIRRAAHSTVPPHAHLTHVATEPTVHGAGVGRVVVAAALERFREAGGGLVVLECTRELERFYWRFGFETVSTFRDPDADDMLLMTARR